MNSHCEFRWSLTIIYFLLFPFFSHLPDPRRTTSQLSQLKHICFHFTEPHTCLFSSHTLPFLFSLTPPHDPGLACALSGEYRRRSGAKNMSLHSLSLSSLPLSPLFSLFSLFSLYRSHFGLQFHHLCFNHPIPSCVSGQTLHFHQSLFTCSHSEEAW